jgi:hypothetical protein
VPDSVELISQVRLSQDRQDGHYLPSYTTWPTLDMSEDGLGPLILANPGKLWLVGNEPDVANIAQDNMYPEMYARAYHDVYQFIKGLDPYAHIGIAGLSMMTPGRLQYLDIVWDTYLAIYGEPMPVDVWNMHLYILPEKRSTDGGNSDGKIALGTDPALAKRDVNGDPQVECPKDEVYCRAEHDDLSIFQEQLVAMRTWMKNHGQQDRPLLLSEYSLLYPFVDYDDPINPTRCYLMDEFGQCFTKDRVIAFMDQTLDYLENAQDPVLGYPPDQHRLVQQWSWYSTWTDLEETGASSNLLVDDYTNYSPDSPNALNRVGNNYRDRIYSRTQAYDLVAGEARDVETAAVQPQGTADVELTAGFFNNGNKLVVDPFQVTFYADAQLTQVIAETTVRPGRTGLINGCSWGRITDWASATWPDVPVGLYNYWAKIDSSNAIKGEIDEDNNVISGQVIVTP